MRKELKNRIQSLLQESRQFNANDVLVNVDAQSNKLFKDQSAQLNYSFDEFPSRIIKETQLTIKETGVNALCFTLGCLKMETVNNESHSPFILVPLEVTKDKIKKRWKFEPDFDLAFINPYILDFLRENDINVMIDEFLENDQFNIEKFKEKCIEWGLSAMDNNDHYIGNFHHHRYQVIKEIEEILEGNECTTQISTLFGFSNHENCEIVELSDSKLLPADTDHYRVFDKVKTNNLVIQGPPGTGKSQVLTNIGAKLLEAGRTTIYISEKRSALEVIKKKLAEFNLDQFCLIATANYSAHNFLDELKESWHVMESVKVNPVKNLRLSEQYTDNLQMTLDLLNQPSLIGGVSYHEFKAGMNGTPVLSGKYSSAVMEIAAFHKMKDLVINLYKKDLSFAIGHFREHAIKSDDFLNHDTILNRAKKEITQLKEQFDFETWLDLTRLMHRSAKCQVLENELYKKYAGIFKPNSRQNKTFLGLYRKWNKVKKQVELEESNHSDWKIVPSEAEVISMQEEIKKGGVFRGLRTKRRWGQLSYLPFDFASSSLKKLRDEHELKNQYTQLIIKFCDLGVESPEIEVPLIRQVLFSIHKDDWSDIIEYSSDERKKYTSNHQRLNELYTSLSKILNIRDGENIEELINAISDKFGELVIIHKEIKELADREIKAIGRNQTFEGFKEEMYGSHWIKFQERFPNYAKFEIKELHQKVQQVLDAEKQEAKLFAAEIIANSQNQFQEYHELLNTPARKLTEEQKALKIQLRKGKALLVKEFGKSRSHPSLRELFNSEARIWIQLLKPIWLSNPTQLANCFPMEMELFDVAIFDEASQIPLQNALGALQRCKRAIVAGDENQMGPTSYFKTGSSEVADLLHQASYNWDSETLKHHYRSVHPDLIAFSNKYFYKGELAAYPAKIDDVVLHHHYIEEGVFEERKNEKEADRIAKLLSTKLKGKKHIGVVAFSEEHLSCIWSALNGKDQELLQDRIDNDRAFFKSLENVQGDECDVLLISFGYGKNAGGEFHMRFGPMNRQNGRKRLNVLLTRARESVHFFCSVKSTDFKLSENESLNLLRMWFQFSENHSKQSSFTFPFGVDPIVEGDTLIFNKIQESFSSAKELVTLQSVLEDRGWKVLYE